MYTNTYRLGPTLVIVGLSAISDVNPPSGTNGGFFKILTGSGSLALAPGLSSPGFWGATLYPVGRNEVVGFNGPARFYLAAATATMIVAVTYSFSSPGISSPIAGG